MAPRPTRHRDEAKGKRQMTIDELAQAAGLTVRNVRNYQSRGLIPPPQVRGRVGYYEPKHLAELQLIREMQAQGFNLTAIAHLLEQARGAEEQVLGFTRSLMAPFETETPEILDHHDLTARLGEELDTKLMARAQRLGLITPLGEDSYEVPSPTLLNAGERLISLGVPLGAALEMMAKLQQQTKRIAQTFVQMFLTYIWEPFDQAERPEPQWPRVQQALDQLRPLASEAVIAAFQQTMTSAVETAFGEQLDRTRTQQGQATSGPAQQ